MGRLCWFENGGCDHKSVFWGRVPAHSRNEQTMAHFFAVQVHFFIEHYAYRGNKFNRSQLTITVQDFCWWHWRSVAVQSQLEARKLSKVYWVLIAKQMRALPTEAERRWVVRVQQTIQICLECRSTCLPAGRKSKKCDKQLTHIVRVSTSILISWLFNPARSFINP